jgi:hypothetical protein
VLLPKLIGTSGNFETIVFGIVLVVVLKYAPDGLWTFVAAPPAGAQRVRDWDGAAALPARDKPAAASCCWRWRRCARSSAAWWRSTTSASRSAPATSSA